MKKRFQKFLFPSNADLISKWRQKALNDLKHCFECVVSYHELLQLELLKTSSLKKKNKIFLINTRRLVSSLEEGLAAVQPGEPYVETNLLQCCEAPLKEVLKYPRFLLHEDVHEVFQQVLLAVVSEEVSEEGGIVQEKLPGLYLLLVHSNEQVSLTRLGALSPYSVVRDNI